MATSKKREGESIDSLLRKFKKQVKNEGTLSEFRSREFHEKPSEKKKRERRAAEQRTQREQKLNELL